MDYSVPNTAYVFKGIHMMLPNIPLMFDQFVHLVKYLLSGAAEAPRKYSSYEQLRKNFNLSTPATSSPLAPYFNRLKQSIGFWHRPTASNSSQWFSVLRGMHTFNRYWKGNRPMLEIDPTSSTTGLILFKQVVYSPLGQDTVFGQNSLNKATHQLINNTDASTSIHYIVSEDFQDAQIAQVNATCPHIFNNAFTIEGIRVTGFGPFWNVKSFPKKGLLVLLFKLYIYDCPLLART
ncbi:hypothetical protein LWI29_002650 [Acer saccharum]|uniref:Uncharacterized protein n=1 Tax=Acer saccharum TaxID=4024 RepID=A0AA39S9S6_ACESA|nr:hypothetical protein LWI29_002650 [Acer saccharum]